MPTASTAATLADSPSPDVTVDTADGATATAAPATDTGVDVDTDPSPTTTAPPTAEHISSFLLHMRRRAAYDATATAASTAAVLAVSPFSDVIEDNATAIAASAADTGMGADTDPAYVDTAPSAADDLLADVADFDSTSAWGDGDEVTAANDFDPTSVWGDGDEVTAAISEAVQTPRKRQHMVAARADDDTDDGATATAASAVGASPRPTKGRKRTSSRGPAHAARRAAFLAAQEHGTTGAT